MRKHQLLKQKPRVNEGQGGETGKIGIIFRTNCPMLRINFAEIFASDRIAGQEDVKSA
jgi:hypothetical protein